MISYRAAAAARPQQGAAARPPQQELLFPRRRRAVPRAKLLAAAAAAARPSSPSPSSSSPPARRPSLLLRPRAAAPARAAVAPPSLGRPYSPSTTSSPSLASTTLASASASLDGGDDGATCPSFIDRDGEFLEAACCDFGFRTGKGRLYSDEYGTIPKGMIELAIENFQYEYSALRRSIRDDEYASIAAQNPPRSPLGWLLYKTGAAAVRALSAADAWLEDRRVFGRVLPVPVPQSVIDPRTGSLSRSCRELRAKLRLLKLDNEAVWEREREREREGGGVETPLVVRGAYLFLCLFLDVCFNNRPIQRFWFLETVARMPYFSMISVLHFFETLGWWRAGAELRKVHAAQELGELHHQAVMENLGGDLLWSDRFLAYHSAVLYYVVLLVMYLFMPKLAYNFSELIEAHAVDSYDVFTESNEALLKELPPPYCAVKYYRSGDLSMFDDFQTRRRVEFSEQLLSAEDEAEEELAAGIPARPGAADCPSRLPPRRPQIRSLYDVFRAISDDEGEHVATMAACIDGSVAAQLRAKDEEREAVQRAMLETMPRTRVEGEGVEGEREEGRV